jgi:hypothetical protein
MYYDTILSVCQPMQGGPTHRHGMGGPTILPFVLTAPKQSNH